MNWRAVPDNTLHETTMLKLDSSKARRQLGWRPALSINEQLKMTAEWYRAFREQKKVISQQQLEAYMKTMTKAAAA
jgi:CDP-glucose 4,6-dehydratase